jgi:hypothetical protein
MTEQDTHTAALELRIAQLQRRCAEQAAKIRRLEGEQDRLRKASKAMINACEEKDWSEPGMSNELYEAEERLRAALGGEGT